MRVIPSLVLAAIAFASGAAVAQYVSHRPPVAAPTAPPAGGGPDAPKGDRDPRADLEGQMMWDPNTRTYQGG